MSLASQGPGWWQASDGRWYPPETMPQASSQQRPLGPPSPSWTVLSASGPLVFAQSEHEYSVYDQHNTYGRWPRTADGYRFANETFAAHSQSLAHGVAYTAAGYRDPVAVGMPVDPVLKSKSYAAPLSFIGSSRRLIAWATKLATRSPAYAVLGWVLAVVAIILAWMFIAVWYSVIFGLFGVFVIPYRLIRRSSRKSLHVQQTALATQQAMYQQMAMMQQRAVNQPYTYSGQYSAGVPLPPAAVPPSLPPTYPPG
jgi:hypothetical protein